MNKTLLLIICDFLLLNLLALTRWEKAEPTRETKPPVPQLASGAATREQDLVETMRLSLADEQNAREQLAAELNQKDQSLNRVRSENANLSSSLENTQRKALELDHKLSSTAQEAAAAQARLSQLQRDYEMKQSESNRQNAELEALQKAQEEARAKIEGLRIAMGVAEQEKLLLRQTADGLRQQVETERAERQKVQQTTVQLAEGVGKLAEKSGELTKEIRDNRPINANILFSDYLANKITVNIRGEHPNGFLGKAERKASTGCVLVTDGTTTYAVLHVDQTPFGFREIPNPWSKLNIELERSGVKTEAKTLLFLNSDPRLIALPLEPDQVAALGGRIYPLAAEPFKFPEAMLVNRGGAGYGETPFRLDAAHPNFVRMDNRLIKLITGEFTPSRGDLVFSKTGEVLGIMVSSDYCAVLGSFTPARSLQLGDTSSQPVERILTELAAKLETMPFRMQ
jgi:hypothetical protein